VLKFHTDNNTFITGIICNVFVRPVLILFKVTHLKHWSNLFKKIWNVIIYTRCTEIHSTVCGGHISL